MLTSRSSNKLLFDFIFSIKLPPSCVIRTNLNSIGILILKSNNSVSLEGFNLYFLDLNFKTIFARKQEVTAIILLSYTRVSRIRDDYLSNFTFPHIIQSEMTDGNELSIFFFVIFARFFSCKTFMANKTEFLRVFWELPALDT